MEGVFGMEEFIGCVSFFFIFVGLIVLMVGGVGIVNVIWNYFDIKIEVIVIYKCFGVSGEFVFWVYVI